MEHFALHDAWVEELLNFDVCTFNLFESEDFMNRKVLLILSTAAMASLGLLTAQDKVALARTVSAVAGTPVSGANQASFNANPLGVTHISAGSRQWIMTLTFNNAGAKNIIVRGRAPAGTTLVCQSSSVDASGNALGNSPVATFTPGAGFQSLPVNLAAGLVPFGATGTLTCNFGGAGPTVIGADYFDP
jgi:hypothetical protein